MSGGCEALLCPVSSSADVTLWSDLLFGLLLLVGADAYRIARENTDGQGDFNVDGLRRMYDWVQQDAGKTVIMSGIQTVGTKFWE